ncbi:ROK family protein [Mycoplasma sp. Ms02]|nr:ROK family protein [Mycoplasma sp. Ms02]
MNEKYNYAAIDIGGTNTRFAIVKDAKITYKVKFATDSQDYKSTLNKIIDLINEHSIDAIGLCIPGPANYEKGMIFKSPNLPGWEHISILDYFKEHSNLKKIVFENDANVMALSNHFSYQQGEKDVTQFFTISTGFGAGLVINNQIYVGTTYQAQEIARLPLGPEKEEGFHLSPYAAELFASGTGIAIRYNKRSNKELNTKEVFDLYRENDYLATKIINQGIETLAKVIATTASLLNPTLIAFGGSVSQYEPWFVKKAIEQAKEFCFESQYKAIRFVFDQNGDDSALIGLYYLIKSKSENEK